MANPGIAVLIPARRASTRLPDKLLLAETGTPLLVHTCTQAAQAYGTQAVIVCADDPVLVRVAEQAGFQARLTRADHQSGTDRIAEVAAALDAHTVVNVQGDEPSIDPSHIRLVAGLLQRYPQAGMATLATPCVAHEVGDPAAVKVVIAGAAAPGTEGPCLYFSRTAIPYDRDHRGPAAGTLRHLGIYAYRREVLLGYARLPASRLEACEKLEQLRALEAGVGLVAAVVAGAAPGIDTRADYDRFLMRTRA